MEWVARGPGGVSCVVFHSPRTSAAASRASAWSASLTPVCDLLDEGGVSLSRTGLGAALVGGDAAAAVLRPLDQCWRSLARIGLGAALVGGGVSRRVCVRLTQCSWSVVAQFALAPRLSAVTSRCAPPPL